MEAIQALLADPWVALWVDATAKAALVVGAAWVALLGLRRQPAAARHAVWCAALLALALLPLMGRVLPPVRLAVRPAGAPPAAEAPAAFVAAAPAALAVPVASAPIAQAAPAASRLPVWTGCAAAVWAAGAGAGLALTALGLGVVALRVRLAAPVTEPEWLSLADEAATRLCLRRPVRLRWGPPRSLPFTCGVFRPAVLVPPEARHWPADRRRCVLLHEFAHVARRDCLLQTLVSVVRALYWYHPLVWLAGRRMEAERERACDDVVLRSGHRASGYAADLLDLVRSLQSVRLGLLAGVAMARVGRLEARLRAILDDRRRRGGPTPPAWVAAGLLVLLVLPLSAVQLARGQEGSPAASSGPAPSTAQARPIAAPGADLLAPSGNAALLPAPGAQPPTAADLAQTQPDPRLAPGDIVELAVANLLTEGVEAQVRRQVQPNGQIDVPLLDAGVDVAGRTPEELRRAVADAYRTAGVLRDPQVSVARIDPASRTFTVVGAVGRPGVYALAGPVRVLDLLGMVGEVASPSINYAYVIRNSAGADRARIILVDLQKLRLGDARWNLAVRPRDVVVVPLPQAGEFYVGGDVARPGVYALSERLVTLKMALVSAGGTASPPARGVLVRRVGGNEVMVPMDFQAILRGDQPDVVLQPDDQILVGTELDAPRVLPVQTQPPPASHLPPAGESQLGPVDAPADGR